MKMAKASQADLDMAMDVYGALDAISSHWPTMPGSEGDDYFDADNPEHCVRAIAHLIETMKRGSLLRVVWGCAVMLDPRNGLVDPNADTIERAPVVARPLSEWHEDMGPVLWWKFPIMEPPYCGRPDDCEWSKYFTHWTPIVVPSNAGQKAQCGECHLQPGERCDVCGAQEGQG